MRLCGRIFLGAKFRLVSSPQTSGSQLVLRALGEFDDVTWSHFSFVLRKDFLG